MKTTALLVVLVTTLLGCGRKCVIQHKETRTIAAHCECEQVGERSSSCKASGYFVAGRCECEQVGERSSSCKARGYLVAAHDEELVVCDQYETKP